MSATAVCEEQVRVPHGQHPLTGPRGVTLGQLLARAHEDVRVRGVADCPVCGSALRSHGVEARCDDCGSRLF